jgi:hypothetical protein
MLAKLTGFCPDPAPPLRPRRPPRLIFKVWPSNAANWFPPNWPGRRPPSPPNCPRSPSPKLSCPRQFLSGNCTKKLDPFTLHFLQCVCHVNCLKQRFSTAGTWMFSIRDFYDINNMYQYYWKLKIIVKVISNGRQIKPKLYIICILE